MNKVIFYFCILFLFIGCKNNTRILDPDITTYKVNIEEKQKVSIFDIFTEASIIPLETNKESIIAWGVPQIYKDKIYILKDRQNSVICFNREGKWLFTINNFGRSNQEYQSLQTLTFDPANDYLWLQEFSGPIHEYTLDGEFI